jgi:ferredoxin-NADP reductase
MRIVFDHADELMPRIKTFWFKPERPVRFEAGQFAEIHIPHEEVDERGDTREFSITSLPGEPLVAFTINFAAHGSSFKAALQRLRAGDALSMTEPMGDFVLPKDPSIPLVFVAAGIGSTPYVSIIKLLKVRDERRDIQLIYNAGSPDDILFEDVWQNYPLHFMPIVTRPPANWHGQTGRLDATKLLNIITPVSNKLIYLAGPQSMIEPLFKNLLAAGVSRSQLLLDYFPGY